MRYLKLFEKFKNIIENIYDIFSDLKDDNVEVQSETKDRYISIIIKSKKPMSWANVKEYVDRTIEYLSVEGYKLQSLDIGNETLLYPLNFLSSIKVSNADYYSRFFSLKITFKSEDEIN